MKNLIAKIEKNQYIKFITILAILLGSFITIGTFFIKINDYFYLNFFIEKNIGNKINDLSAGQSINYFKQLLGSERLQREVSEKYTEYIFQYKSAFIQALADKKNNEIIYWAITYCGENPIVIKRPVFLMAALYKGDGDIDSDKNYDYVFGNKLLLNKSSFADIFKNGKGDFKYFVSGATANSYAYESLYLGNPSAYQTIIIGTNDICPSTGLYKYLDVMGNSSSKQIENFRENGRVNTYGETAPLKGGEVLKLLNTQQSDNVGDSYITFGADRIRIRFFSR